MLSPSDAPSNKLQTYTSSVNSYLRAVLALIKHKYSNIVYSVLLFGSLASKTDFTSSSDVDLLIVLNTNNRRIIKKLERQLIYLENIFFCNVIKDKPFILRAIEMQTGMFRNFFITTLDQLQRHQFAETFHTSRLLSHLLAPKNIVFHSVITKSRILWGKDVRPFFKKPLISKYDLIRSMLMNLLMVYGLYMIFFLYFKKAHLLTTYVMNSIKWSIHACYTYITQTSRSLPQETLFLSKYLKSRIIQYGLFLHLSLRKNKRECGIFFLIAPLLIWKLHSLTLHTK